MPDNISDMWMYEAGRAYGGRMELVEIAVILGSSGVMVGKKCHQPQCLC